MEDAQRTEERLTPEERRARLRAFADRMLMALGGIDDPEDGDDIEKGIRLALMIERVYARVDASEAQAPRRAAEAISDRVTLRSRVEWGEDRLKQKLSVPFVTLADAAPAPLAPAPFAPEPQADAGADTLSQTSGPAAHVSDDRISNGIRLMLQGLMPDDQIEALINCDDEDDDDTS